MQIMQRLLLLAGLLALALWFYNGRNATVAIETATGLAYPNYKIELQKPYRMRARVLSTQDYSSGREAELSPTDLVLGWGSMMDLQTLAEIEITQRGRFYFWKVAKLPIPRKDIEHHSANVHIVPANQNVARQLTEVETGDVVTLRGQLISVTGSDGWRWRSSLSFTDTGKGACELLWLESLTQS
jgi:hypothetical protein